MPWLKPVQHTPAPVAPKSAAPVAPAVPADGRVALTASADYVIARDQFSFTKAGTGLAGLADAKTKTLNNGHDDLVIQAGDDAYILSAKRLEVPTGKLPREGDGITVTANGASLQGVVRFVSQESDLIAARQASDAAQAAREGTARRKNNEAAIGAGAAIFLLGAAVTGAAVKKNLR